MRTFYRFDPETGKWVEAWRNIREANAPMVIQDSMEPTINHADGKVYDSRSKYHQATKDAGCVELTLAEVKANADKKRTTEWVPKDSVLYDTLERAYYDLRDNRIPRPEGNPAQEVWNKHRRG